MAQTEARPSSSISISTPYFSIKPLMVLPPEPITSPILSSGRVIILILGAYWDNSARGAGSTESILSKI